MPSRNISTNCSSFWNLYGIRIRYVRIFFFFFFFCYWLYNPGWVLVCSAIPFHTCLSSIFTLQPVILTNLFRIVHFK